MFDFPNSPTIGQQIIEPNGAVAQWDGVKWTNVAGQVSSVTPAFNNVGRNLIHNSMFNIQQRGSGPFTAIGYTLDRWTLTLANDTVSIQLAVANDAQRTAIGDEAATVLLTNTFTGNAAATSINYFIQKIEGVRRISGKTVTLSFWASASATQKLGINMYQDFGTGGSPSTGSWIFTTGQSIQLSGTWTRYSVTINMPTATGKTTGTGGNDCTWLAFFFSCGANTNAIAGNIGVQSGVIQLWGVQLEIGSTATQLEKIDYQDDFKHCQRFFQVHSAVIISGIATSGGQVMWSDISLPVTMRGLPTTSLFNANYSNGNSFAATAVSTGHVRTQVSATAAGSFYGISDMTLTADL